MVTSLFLNGWMIGFSIAMPVGPIGMLCIRHSLTRGSLYGVAAGLGAALADTVYGVMAGFGLTMICEILSTYRIPCQLFGALFLCYLGISYLRKKKESTPRHQTFPSSFTRILMTTFLLTLSNPLTLLSFMGIYTALGIGLIEEKVLTSAFILNGGIFLGSLVWWLILSFSTAFIGKKLNFQSTQLLNRISGVLFLCFGVASGVAAMHYFF